MGVGGGSPEGTSSQAPPTANRFRFVLFYFFILPGGWARGPRADDLRQIVARHFGQLTAREPGRAVSLRQLKFFVFVESRPRPTGSRRAGR